MESPKIENGTTETVDVSNVNGKFLLHTSGTFGGGSLVLKLNGEDIEDGAFTSNVTREVLVAGTVSLVLSGATDVTVYFNKIY